MSQFIHLYSEYLQLQKGRRGWERGEGSRIPENLTAGRAQRRQPQVKKEKKEGGKEGGRQEGRMEKKMRKEEDGFNFI